MLTHVIKCVSEPVLCRSQEHTRAYPLERISITCFFFIKPCVFMHSCACMQGCMWGWGSRHMCVCIFSGQKLASDVITQVWSTLFLSFVFCFALFWGVSHQLRAHQFDKAGQSRSPRDHTCICLCHTHIGSLTYNDMCWYACQALNPQYRD